MRSGRLRHSITIQKRATGLDAGGQPTGAWDDFVRLLARIEQLSGRELESARQKDATASHRIETRFFAGVSPKDRVRFQGRYLYVASVDDVQHLGREMVLVCGETVS